MRSGESSIERRPDSRICVVQRISDGMKECEGDGNQKKSEDVEKECRTSGGQTDMTDNRCFGYRFKGKEKQFVFIFFVQQETSEKFEIRKIYDQTDELCSVVLNFLKFLNELLRTASE